MSQDLRYPIWKKDDFFLIGGKRLDMAASAVVFDQEKYVLTWGFDFDVDHIIGLVSNVKLEDNEILGDLEIKDDVHYEAIDGVSTGVHTTQMKDTIFDMLERGDARLGGFYNEVVEKDRIVHHARLRSVGVVLSSNMPKVTP